MSGALSLGTFLDEAATALAAGGLEEPRREARALVAAFLPGGSAALYDRDRSIDPKLIPALRAAVSRRAQREPLGRILGVREFWSLEIGLSADTLEPRADSETLVEAALAAVPDRRGSYRILDLGTGSGCLLLAILSERPMAWGLGIDRAEGAVRQAAVNARVLDLNDRALFLCSDWGTALAGGFDLIVSNPPYIETGTLSALQPEVARHDPLLALDGGCDGLDAYRRLVPEAFDLLQPGGALVLEFGVGQQSAIEEILRQAGLDQRAFSTDLSGTPRALCARRPQ